LKHLIAMTDLTIPNDRSFTTGAPPNIRDSALASRRFQSGLVFFTQKELVRRRKGISNRLGSQPTNGNQLWLSIGNHLLGVCT
jgi:hypothetical protein